MKAVIRRISGGVLALLCAAALAAQQPSQHARHEQQDPGAPGATPPSHVHYTANENLEKPGPTGELAPRLQNLGSHAFPVSCLAGDDTAQKFFNQGVNLSYGFNHAEAARAFREVARRAPDCAMAYWGHALVLGPNINAPMDPEAEPQADELVEKAMSLRGGVTPRERDYIEALARRYTGNAEDRAANDRAYADAMRALAKKYPDDLDARTLFAEAMMTLRPWDYWTRDGQPYDGTGEIVAALEHVMAVHADHPGALHLWIHVMEPTATPERAEEAADRLLPLMPAAGHMVHMPSHIYIRIGRYADAVRTNELASAADEDYITQCRVQGFYPVSYYPHNVHFLWYAQTMLGNGAAALEAARKTASVVPVEAVREVPALQFFHSTPYYALVRFGRWDDILREPRPAFDGAHVIGIWHWARGMAFVATEKFSEAEQELVAVRRLAADPEVQKLALWTPNTVGYILDIAAEMLAGELAAKRGAIDQAIPHLERAVRLEDGLVYTEPPDWPQQVRQSLGAVLLQAGRPREAEVVYWEDLKRNPENGWSLYGLWQALAAQGREDEATLAEQRFRKAWSQADAQLAASRF
jgi:tetratricopeptide (TPR) repeat protein